jgi:tetratricopeptide (TPR) repeat protein
MAVVLIIFYFFRVVMEWPVSWIFGVYAALLIVICLVFRAGFYYFMANMSFSLLKNREKSKELFLKSAALGSKNPLTYLNYAILQMQDNNAEEALEYANKALAMNPDIMADKNARLTVSSAYWYMGKVDLAVEALEELRAKYDYVNSYVLTSLGYLYIVKGDLAKARKITDLAIEDSPDSGAAWDNLGQIYLKEGDREKAKETFLKALSIKDNLVDCCYFLGEIYEQEGDIRNAKEYFERAKGCKLSRLNTATQAMIDKKYDEYASMEIENTEIEDMEIEDMEMDDDTN